MRELLHRGHVTQEGLAKPLKTFREVEADLPAKITRSEVNRANHERFERVRHELDIPPVSGGIWKWPLAEPNRLLAMMESESRALQELFAAALQRCGDPSQERPWSRVLGHDEFSPGGMFSVGGRQEEHELIVHVPGAWRALHSQ